MQALLRIPPSSFCFTSEFSPSLQKGQAKEHSVVGARGERLRLGGVVYDLAYAQDLAITTVCCTPRQAIIPIWSKNLPRLELSVR